jgi:hypothetical protein
MVFHIVIKWRPKLYIIVLEDYRNNLVQVKGNNANRIDERQRIRWRPHPSWKPVQTTTKKSSKFTKKITYVDDMTTL